MTVNKMEHSLSREGKQTLKVPGTSNENKSMKVSMSGTVRKIQDKYYPGFYKTFKMITQASDKSIKTHGR